MPLYPLIIIIITISFMQGIYAHVTETNNVPKEYNVAATVYGANLTSCCVDSNVLLH
jgi:ABC-type nitrate/sulfonate/bicarbonate transport system permease component